MSVDTTNTLLEYNHYDLAWGTELSFPNTRTLRQSSHRIFNRYPARSISLVPRSIIRSTKMNNRRKLSVLDPFMGSGTTAVETVIAGHDAFGVEIDPLARLITEVRLHQYLDSDIFHLRKNYTDIVKQWQKCRPDSNLSPQLQNIQYWFSSDQFRDLLKLKSCIYKNVGIETVAGKFFRVVLADMIRPTSLAERQSLKPYISKKYTKIPVAVSDAFKKSFESHISAIHEFRDDVDTHPLKPLTWIGFNATDFTSGRRKMDCVITSPPYANALDYVRCIKIESAWVDCGDPTTFAMLQKSQVGGASRLNEEYESTVNQIVGNTVTTISQIDKARAKTILNYFSDIYKNLKCVFKILKPRGEYHMIVGDSVIRGVEVPTHRFIAELAELIGFEWVQYYTYPIRDHRTSIPRQGQGGKIRHEHVISLRKI